MSVYLMHIGLGAEVVLAIEGITHEHRVHNVQQDGGDEVQCKPTKRSSSKGYHLHDVV
jgi:hypothetical protein